MDVTGDEVSEKIAFVPVMRSGLGMVDGFIYAFPNAQVVCLFFACISIMSVLPPVPIGSCQHSKVYACQNTCCSPTRTGLPLYRPPIVLYANILCFRIGQLYP